MNVAFKEWAVVCDALAAGRQVLILRKGGTDEDDGQFRPDHEEFLLLPTYVHEASSRIVPDAQPRLRQLEATKPDAQSLVFSHLAAVTEAVEVKTLAALRSLRGQHIWSEAEVEERFHRWRQDQVYALVVRVLALPVPVKLPMKPSYAGCKSWVHLDTQVETSLAKPVLSDPAFDALACTVRLSLT